MRDRKQIPADVCFMAFFLCCVDCYLFVNDLYSAGG